MKAKLTKGFSDNGFVDYLNKEGIEFKDAGSMVEIDVNDHDEIYELGYRFAVEKYREKPETFEIHADMVPVMKEAISNYSTKSYITVDGFGFGEPDTHGWVKVTVQPTKGGCLYGIYTEMGKLLAARQGAKTEA